MRDRVRPFLKWAGGKYALSEQVLATLPDGDTLVEPFVGSGAIFIRSDYKRYILNDINADLINCFRTVQASGAQYFVDAADYFQPRYNDERRYYALRETFNASTDLYERAVLFLYLNRHGYNGLCRYNRSGRFNVPFGRYKGPRFPEEELHVFYLKSKRARFVCGDFRQLFKKAKSGQVFYCDPPYVPLSDTAYFTDFSSTGFGMQDQQDLADHANEVVARGVPILISNHNMPLTRKLYRGAGIKTLKVRRHISCNIESRAEVSELLASFVPPLGAGEGTVAGKQRTHRQSR